MEKVVAAIYIIALGFIAIAYPFLMIITIWEYPIYVIVSFWIWVISSIGWIVLSGKQKISQYIIPILCLDLVFTLFFLSGSSSTSYMQDEPLWYFIAPTLCLPAWCFIGIKCLQLKEYFMLDEGKRLVRIVNMRLQKKRSVLDEIISLIDEVSEKQKSVEILLRLINLCTDNVDFIKFYNKRLQEENKHLLTEIQVIAKKEKIEISFNDKLLIDIVEECKQLKYELLTEMISEDAVSINDYKRIKVLYKKYKEES